MHNDDPENQPQHQNLLAMAKMIKDAAIADDMDSKLASASLEEIVVSLRGYVLPKYGQKAKGYITH